VESCLEHWPVRANRIHARWWRTAAAVALATIATLTAAERAGATVTLGQLAPGTPSADCSSTADYLQPSITGGNLYIARQAGTITSWSTRSSGPGATYVFKVFRRTSDPDVFQVIAHAPQRVLTSGTNTVPVNIAVRAGDMIGLNENGTLVPNACTFAQPGDGVLSRAGSLSDGATGTFSPVNDVRLNLSAVLVPSNDLSIAAITRDRKQGTAIVIVNVSNPGVITLTGTGLKKRPSRNVAVAGTIQFKLASVGAKKRKLEKRGKVTLSPSMTFSPSGGDPATLPFTVKLLLRKRKPTPSVQTP
jgi:hypothetical protein